MMRNGDDRRGSRWPGKGSDRYEGVRRAFVILAVVGSIFIALVAPRLPNWTGAASAQPRAEGAVAGKMLAAISSGSEGAGRLVDEASRGMPWNLRAEAAGGTTGATAEEPMASPTPLTTQEQQTIDLINQRRTALGLTPMRVDWALVAAARRHSNDIGPRGLCQHEGTDGSSPWDRIAQAGYTGFGNGEVIGCGYNTPLGVVDAWWNSPGHYAILTNVEANDIGCGWWLDPQGYGWQTCDTGIGSQLLPTPTVVLPTATRTSTRTATRTPTRTATPMRTNTPAATPTAASLVGHVAWQGRPAQPDLLQRMPVTLTLKAGNVEVNYGVQTTDASGFFTVSVAGLANGNYAWRAKGPTYLANSGTVGVAGLRAATTLLEIGLMRVGDADGDNVVGASDFNILRATMGRAKGTPGYDARADFNGDDIVNSVDFNLMRQNSGSGGAPPLGP